MSGSFAPDSLMVREQQVEAFSGVDSVCDLLGISSRYPAMIELSFQKLMERTETVNSDGWGAVFYEKNDAYVFREPRPGSVSRLAGLLGHCGVESSLAISHIRKATGGAVELRNTHPFTREIHGRLHSFAFNGDVPEVFDERFFRQQMGRNCVTAKGVQGDHIVALG